MAIAKQVKLYLVSFGFFSTQEIQMLMRTQFCVQKFKMFLKCKDSYCELFTMGHANNLELQFKESDSKEDFTLLLKQNHRNKHNQKQKNFTITIFIS